MSQFVMSRRVFAGIVVVMVIAASPFVEPEQPRRVVAHGRLSRRGGQVVASGRLPDLNAVPTAVGR